MRILRYILRSFWQEAGVIYRICSLLLVGFPAAIAAATGFFGIEWSKDQFPWWFWLGWALILALGVVLWAVAKHAYRVDEDIRPRLRISLGTADPYEMTRHSKDGKITVRRVRVCVENMGAERLDNCHVLMDEMINYHNAYCPITLKQMSDNPPDALNQSHKQYFTLNPHAREFIDVAEFQEGKSETEPIRLCYATEGHRSHDVANTIPQGGYTIVIKATADKGYPSYSRCELSTETGQLTIRDVSAEQ